MQSKFVAIDFETATKNYNSACSIGLVVFNNTEVIDEFYSLIQPPNNFYNDDNIKIHKITPQDTETAETFPAVYEKIKHYFNGDYIIIAQNAQFDMSVLKACMVHYSLEQPNFTYWDSIRIASFVTPKGIRKGLKSLTDFFEITLDNHHNALCDARACADICVKCFNQMSQDSYYIKKDGNFKKYILNKLDSQFVDLVLKQKLTSYRRNTNTKNSATKNTPFTKFNSIKLSDYPPNENATNNKFKNKNIVITGDIPSLPRENLYSLLSNYGGVLKSSVTKKTDILIVGTQDKSLVGASGISTKEQKALQYINDDINIEIIREPEFKNILSTLN